jgi:ferredoxin
LRSAYDYWAKIMAAVRIASLELENKYNEEIHGDYFLNFNWSNFTVEELAVCPPVIIIEDSDTILEAELTTFSALLARNKPIRIIALKRIAPFESFGNGKLKEDTIPNKAELAALAISQRNVFTLQSSGFHSNHLFQGLKGGFTAGSPALFHIIIPFSSKTEWGKSYVYVNAPVEARQFPLFIYDEARGSRWGSRFDISANPSPENRWPEYDIEVYGKDGKKNPLKLAFTPADLFATDTLNVKKLRVVEPELWTDELIPVDEYLALPTDDLYGKLPFIWLSDAERNLFRAVIPLSLVLECKERLEFWSFIQELGGVNSFHVDQAVNKVREELKAELELKLAGQNELHETALEQARKEATGTAMDKLVSVLLDLDQFQTQTILPPAPVAPKPTGPKSDETAITETVVPAKPAVVISADAWVDSIRCTSCNECVDKYPRAFKYDKEKLAYVDDPTSVTYAQLVQAAIECPVKCIHPGQPLNPSEPDLEQWIAKAEPFN